MVGSVAGWPVVVSGGKPRGRGFAGMRCRSLAHGFALVANG
jgi:hypothetical protein